MSGGVSGVLQVVVDPNDLRTPPGQARLLKFHGCIVHATQDPKAFRRFLTGSHTQIVGWPERAAFAAMRNAVVNLATTQKTLVLGLSIQDNNLQTLFARANEAQAWPWPCAPAAPAYVFCEDKIQLGQRDVLRLSYGDAYNDDPAAIHDATLLRAWGETVLIALVLKLLCDTVTRLMELGLEALEKESMANALAPLLKALRNEIAQFAIPTPGVQTRTDFVNRAIILWSRILSLFRSGALPANVEAYETVSSSTLNLIAANQNAQVAGLGRLGVALSLLQHGRAAGYWELRPPASLDLVSGAMTARAARQDAMERPLFLVKSATDAIALKTREPSRTTTQ